jgi:hypothetical protein
MRVVESQYSLSFAVVKGERVVEAVRPGRGLVDLLDDKSQALAVLQPVDQTIKSQQELKRVVLQLQPYPILIGYEYGRSVRMSSLAG